MTTVIQLKKVRTGWVVRLQQDATTVLEYRYPSEKQARFMYAVFNMGPSHLPPPHAVKKTRVRKTTAEIQPNA